MTTLSKEDVVRMAEQLGLKTVGDVWNMMRDGDDLWYSVIRLHEFATLARADLVAENERLKATPPDQRQDLHCVVSDIAAECRELHDQLTAARTALAAAEADNERLRDVINMWVGIASNCSIESGCCHCGDSMNNHASPFICGHSPVDMADAAVMNALKKSNEAFDQPRDDSALREMIAGVYEECAKLSDSYAYMSQGFVALSEELRAQAEKAKGK